MTRLVLPEFFQARANGFHVVRGSHQFETVQVRHAAFAGHDIARIGELGAEVVVAVVMTPRISDRSRSYFRNAIILFRT